MGTYTRKLLFSTLFELMRFSPALATDLARHLQADAFALNDQIALHLRQAGPASRRAYSR